MADKGSVKNGLRAILRKKLTLIILLVIAALVVGLGAWKYLDIKSDQRNKVAEAEFVELTKSVNDLTYKKDYEQATAKLTDYASRTSNQEYKYSALTQLGAVYLNQADYQKALEIFVVAKDIDNQNDLAAVVGIALAAEQLGEKKVAVEAYKAAIEILKIRNNEGYAAQDIKHYESKIKLLEGES